MQDEGNGGSSNRGAPHVRPGFIMSRVASAQLGLSNQQVLTDSRILEEKIQQSTWGPSVSLGVSSGNSKEAGIEDSLYFPQAKHHNCIRTRIW